MKQIALLINNQPNIKRLKKNNPIVMDKKWEEKQKEKKGLGAYVWMTQTS